MPSKADADSSSVPSTERQTSKFLIPRARDLSNLDYYNATSSILIINSNERRGVFRTVYIEELLAAAAVNRIQL
jgi:hypothetical protein